MAWLYEDGANAKKNEYKKFLEELQNGVKDIAQREYQYKTIPERLFQFSGVLNSYDQFVQSTVGLFSRVYFAGGEVRAHHG